MKEGKCVQVGDNKNVDKTSEEWQKNVGVSISTHVPELGQLWQSIIIYSLKEDNMLVKKSPQLPFHAFAAQDNNSNYLRPNNTVEKALALNTHKPTE